MGGEKKSIKKELFEDMALLGKAVGHPVRLEILDFLAQAEHTVEKLAVKCGQKLGNVSQHLKILSQAGLVERRRIGNFIAYRQSMHVQSLTEAITRTAVHTLPQVQRLVASYFEDRRELYARSAEEILAGARDGSIVLLDVRPDEEFESGHIRGAVSMPLRILKRKIQELPADKKIVAYCRGPYCVLAVEAVRMLREAGYKAFRLENGYPQWKSRRGATEGAGPL